MKCWFAALCVGGLLGPASEWFVRDAFVWIAVEDDGAGGSGLYRLSNDGYLINGDAASEEDGRSITLLVEAPLRL